MGAAAGALLEHPELLLHPPGGWLYYFTNKTIVGGLGSLVGVELTKKRLGIGRVGCFLSGLEDGTYGTATALPWGHQLRRRSPPHQPLRNSVPRGPGAAAGGPGTPPAAR